MSSVPYTITISGNNNDSNLILSSANGNIVESSYNLVNLDNVNSRISNIESSMNTVTTLKIGVAMGVSSSEKQFPIFLDEELNKLSHGEMRAEIFFNTSSPTTGSNDDNASYPSAVLNDISNSDGIILDGTLGWAPYATGFSSNISQLAANGIACAYTGLNALEVIEYYTSEEGIADYEIIYSGSPGGRLMGIPAAQLGSESFGWSKTEIKTLQDMKDLSSIRMPDSGSNTSNFIYEISKRTYGNNVVGISGGGLLARLDTSINEWDFWEWNGIGADYNLIANNKSSFAENFKKGNPYEYYYPNGVQQQTMLADLIMKKTRYESFSHKQRLWLREACFRVAKRFHDYRIEQNNILLNNIINNQDGWSSKIKVRDTPIEIINQYKKQTKNYIETTQTIKDDISFNNMLRNLLNYESRISTRNKQKDLENQNILSSITPLVGLKTAIIGRDNKAYYIYEFENFENDPLKLKFKWWQAINNSTYIPGTVVGSDEFNTWRDNSSNTVEVLETGLDFAGYSNYPDPTGIVLNHDWIDISNEKVKDYNSIKRENAFIYNNSNKRWYHLDRRIYVKISEANWNDISNNYFDASNIKVQDIHYDVGQSIYQPDNSMTYYHWAIQDVSYTDTSGVEKSGKRYEVEGVVIRFALGLVSRTNQYFSGTFYYDQDIEVLSKIRTTDTSVNGLTTSLNTIDTSVNIIDTSLNSLINNFSLLITYLKDNTDISNISDASLSSLII